MRILYSADKTDIYSSNLRDGARKAFSAPEIGFTVTEAAYEPTPAKGS